MHHSVHALHTSGSRHRCGRRAAKKNVQQEKVVVLKGQVEDFEPMRRLQMQIESNLVLELNTKRQEMHEFEGRLACPTPRMWPVGKRSITTQCGISSTW